jgi:hypothetical protein
MTFSGALDNAACRDFSRSRGRQPTAAPTGPPWPGMRRKMRDVSERLREFVSKRYQELGVISIWVVSLLPGVIVSLRKGDPWHATVVVVTIQLLASFGSITLFGVVAQLICYKYIQSTEVHDRMMDGLFFGFHAGMVLWIGYGFYHILFGRKIIGDVNDLVAIFGISCIGSCVLGIAIGFLVGKFRDGNTSIV